MDIDMAKRTEIEDWAISRKIVILMREGYPQRQATAIAFRMFKDGELNIPKESDRKARQQKRREDFRRRMLRRRRDQ
jgi:type III secretory pathway lipoprotein EscJ